jgi:two-component system, OmpR family, response regulator
VRDFQSVLYVDDDPDICRVVQATLELVPGLTVHTAESGARAIDLAFELRPDLMLMDVMMPGLDGPSTFGLMRENRLLRGIPVIFMTAKVLPTEIGQLLELGAIGVIVKPFDPLKLHGELFSLWNSGDSLQPGSIASGSPAEVTARLDSLTASFLQRAWADVINLAKMIQRAQAGDRTVYGEIERICHSIHGAGAMFGFPKISEEGGALSRMIADVTAHSKASNSAIECAKLQQLLEFSKRLAQEVEAAWQTSPESTAMFQTPDEAR